MWRNAMWLAAALLAASCGSNSFNGKYDQTQTAVTPKGTIIVHVSDHAGQPLSGVTVDVVGLSASFVTDDKGVATFADAVVNSNYEFRITKADYMTVYEWASVAGGAGNSPLAGAYTTLTATLFKTDATIKGTVFLPNGKPAKGAVLSLSWGSVGSVTADADGNFTFSKVPSSPTGLQTNIIAHYYDENNDGLVDYATSNAYVTCFPGETSRAFLTYVQYSGYLQQRIVASNVFGGALAPGADISVVFGLPIQAGNFDQNSADAFVLVDNTGREIAVSVTYKSDTEVTIKPLATLVAGQVYTLQVNVTNASASAGNNTPNFSQNLAFQVRPDSVAGITAQATNFTVLNGGTVGSAGGPTNSSAAAATIFDYNSNVFAALWDSVAGAVRYRIYAKDTKRNPDWVLINEVTEPTSSTNAHRVQTAFTLPNTFDQLPNSFAIEPLANGNNVTFAVVPVDVYGHAAAVSGAAPITVADTQPPRWTTSLRAVNPSASALPDSKVDAWNDDGTAPVLLSFNLFASEPMDSTAPPTFTGQNNPTANWAWDATINAFVLRLSIAAGTDASGPILVRGGKDTSGNTILNGDIQETLSGYRDLLSHGTFEDTNCSLTPWLGTQTDTMPVPVAVASNGAVGRCAALIGVTSTSTPATGISRLYQDVPVTIQANTNWRYRVKVSMRPTFVGTGTPGTQMCRITDQTNSPLVNLFAYSGANLLSNQSTFTDYTPASSTTLRFACEVSNPSGPGVTASTTALYIDEFSYTLIKPGSL